MAAARAAAARRPVGGCRPFDRGGPLTAAVMARCGCPGYPAAGSPGCLRDRRCPVHYAGSTDGRTCRRRTASVNPRKPGRCGVAGRHAAPSAARRCPRWRPSEPVRTRTAGRRPSLRTWTPRRSRASRHGVARRSSRVAMDRACKLRAAMATSNTMGTANLEYRSEGPCCTDPKKRRRNNPTNSRAYQFRQLRFSRNLAENPRNRPNLRRRSVADAA